MIHQFAELGQYYREREGIGTADGDQLALYSHDPAQKFRTTTVVLLVFSEGGFSRVQIEQYDDSKKLQYLYRPGPANGCDATPTSGFKPTSSLKVKPSTKEEFDEALSNELRKKSARLARSVGNSLEAETLFPDEERQRLERLHIELSSVTSRDATAGPDLLGKIVAQVHEKLPPETKKNTIISQDAIISVAWQTAQQKINRVGDFEAFRRSLVRCGTQAASTNKGAGDVKGIGQCSVCGKANVEVSGLLQIPNFKLYTLDKPGSVSGGFDPSTAWRNFPACRECCDAVDFAGERVKKRLAFDYYGFKYLVLPSPIQPAQTLAYEFLDRLTDARVNRSAMRRLTAAEDEILYVVALERNQLQVDLLFYKPDPQSFRPALYVSGLVPTRFRLLFDAKGQVDAHVWLNEPSPKPFAGNQFTFGSLRNVFPTALGGSTFDDDFLAATRAAFELRKFSTRRMLEIGMRGVQQDYRDRRNWQSRLVELFRCILFFEILTGSKYEEAETVMSIGYGDSEQSDRVRKLFNQVSGKLEADAAAQAAFLIGACCGRIETIQEHARGSSPFSGKLKGFRLNQSDVQRLFVSAKDKSRAYGPDKERTVSGLLECAAAALAATPERWLLSPDEVSYFFAMGHALRSRFAKDADIDIDSEAS